MKQVLLILRTLLATLALLPVSVTSASSSEEIEKQLLSYLGMVRRPRAPSIEVPDIMIKMYEAQSGLEYETTNFAPAGKHTGSANTLRSLNCANKQSDIVDSSKKRSFLRFEKTSWGQEELKAAELRVHIEPDSETHKRRLFSVSVMEVVSASRKAAPVLRTLDTKVMDAGDLAAASGWYSLDVMPAVERWAQKNTGGGLVIEVRPVSEAKRKLSTEVKFTLSTRPSSCTRMMAGRTTG